MEAEGEGTCKPRLCNQIRAAYASNQRRPVRAVIESTVKSASKLEWPFLTVNRILRYTI